jgi:hypothetical protein
MPLLRHILSNATDKSHALLRAKALECISLVGMSVGREQFREDAHRVMQFMQSLQVGIQAPAALSPAQPVQKRAYAGWTEHHCCLS